MQKSESEASIQTSLGLNMLCQKLEGLVGLNVLELGPARNANIEFWSRYQSSLFIADLRSGLPLQPLAEDQHFPESEWDRMLAIPAERLFDVILAWDLFNYIELPTLTSLVNYLTRFCRPGTLLFFICFDQPQMPDEIAICKIVDDRHIEYECSGKGMRACPRHQPRALTAILKQFQTADSFRLKNGIVEYLFTFEEPAP
jgi:hypothetical protein